MGKQRCKKENVQNIKYEYDKTSYYYFVSSMLLIMEMYHNYGKLVNESVISVNDKLKNFFKDKELSNELKNGILDYTKVGIEESMKTAIIVLLYSEFEKYLKELFNIDNIGRLSLGNFITKYTNYNYQENTNYEEVEKYRMLYNAIKHGTPTDTFIKKYKEMVVKSKDGRMTYKYSFYITDDNIIDCFNCLTQFVKELNTYEEDYARIN